MRRMRVSRLPAAFGASRPLSSHDPACQNSCATAFQAHRPSAVRNCSRSARDCRRSCGSSSVDSQRVRAAPLCKQGSALVRDQSLDREERENREPRGDEGGDAAPDHGCPSAERIELHLPRAHDEVGERREERPAGRGGGVVATRPAPCGRQTPAHEDHASTSSVDHHDAENE